MSGAPTALSQAIARAQSQQALDWTCSNPTRAGLDYGAYGPPERWLPHERLLHYAPHPLGAPEARQAIAEAWPAPGRADPSQIAVCPSSSAAYRYLMTLLCDPGDELLAPEPSYPLFDHLAHYSGVTLRRYRLAYDGRWHIDLESLRAARTPRTRGILIVSPNNPTGSRLTRGELQAIAQLGLPLIVDEVFERFVFAPESGDSPALADSRRDSAERRGTAHGSKSPLGQPVGSALGASNALAFCIDGLSKSAGLPQIKASWIGVSGPEAACSAALERLTFMLDAELPVSAHANLALQHLLPAVPGFAAAVSERLRRNLGALSRGLAGSAAHPLRAEGGWSAIVRLPDIPIPVEAEGRLDSETDGEDAWTRELLRQGLIVQPGYFYDLLGGPHVVVSLLLQPELFDRAVARLRATVDSACG